MQQSDGRTESVGFAGGPAGEEENGDGRGDESCVGGKVGSVDQGKHFQGWGSVNSSYMSSVFAMVCCEVVILGCLELKQFIF